jgi:hypothetical protein
LVELTAPSKVERKVGKWENLWVDNWVYFVVVVKVALKETLLVAPSVALKDESMVAR